MFFAHQMPLKCGFGKRGFGSMWIHKSLPWSDPRDQDTDRFYVQVRENSNFQAGVSNLFQSLVVGVGRWARAIDHIWGAKLFRVLGRVLSGEWGGLF